MSLSRAPSTGLRGGSRGAVGPRLAGDRRWRRPGAHVAGIPAAGSRASCHRRCRAGGAHRTRRLLRVGRHVPAPGTARHWLTASARHASRVRSDEDPARPRTSPLRGVISSIVGSPQATQRRSRPEQRGDRSRERPGRRARPDLALEGRHKNGGREEAGHPALIELPLTVRDATRPSRPVVLQSHLPADVAADASPTAPP